MSSTWTLFTNHAHVLFCISEDPDIRLRDVADRVGITERAAQRIVAELEDAGYVTHERNGRRNHYDVNPEARLRHPIEDHVTVGDLLGVLGASTVSS
jgi:DNA-binding MarR family transcriptional regulator